MFKLDHSQIIEVIFLTMLILTFVVLIVVLFGFLVKQVEHDMNKVTKKMINSNSNVVIDIEKKLVYKTQLNNKERKEIETLKLDDFIYSLSINPETKTFRELLKLINNNATKTQILNKYKSIKHFNTLTTLKYSDTKASIAMLEIEKNNKEVGEYIKFKLNESFFSFKKNEQFREFLVDEIVQFDENELHQELYKDVMNLKAKGWTLIKIQNLNESLLTEKDNFINLVQMLKLKLILKNIGINSYISKQNELFFAHSTGKVNDYFLIRKYWENKIQALLNKEKLYYFDLSSNEILINTTSDIIKDPGTVDVALMVLEKLSSELNTNRNSKTIIDNAKLNANEINLSAIEFLKEYENKSLSMMYLEDEFIERSPKSIVEFYPDSPEYNLSEIINHSYMNKEKIILIILEQAMNEMVKHKNKLCTVVFNLKNIYALANVLEDIKPNNKLMFSIAEDGTKYTKSELNKCFSKIRSKGHELIQLIKDVEDGSTELYISMKPKYVIYTKDFSKIDIEEKISIGLDKLKIAKDKKTIILNTK